MNIPILEVTPRCISCNNCLLICPEDSILTDGDKYSIETFSCTLCGICVEVCPVDCIKFKEPEED